MTISPLLMRKANIAEAPRIYELHCFFDFLFFSISGPMAVVKVCIPRSSAHFWAILRGIPDQRTWRLGRSEVLNSSLMCRCSSPVRWSLRKIRIGSGMLLSIIIVTRDKEADFAFVVQKVHSWLYAKIDMVFGM